MVEPAKIERQAAISNGSPTTILEPEETSSIATTPTSESVNPGNFWQLGELEDWETQGDPHCERCHGLGWMARRAPRSRHMVNELVACKCIWIRQERQRLERYGDFAHMTFESYVGRKDVVDAVRRFAVGDLPQRFLVLKGPTGVGKTHLEVAAVKEAHNVGIVGRIAYVARMFDEMRQAIEAGSLEGVFRYYADTELLCIDDQGLENQSNWTAERWDYLINERYTLGNKTIIGTNLETDQIPPRIADRIFDAKHSLVFTLKGQSRRGKGDR